MPRFGFSLLAALGCVMLGLSWARALSLRVRALTAWARVLSRLDAGLSNHMHTMEALLVYSVEGEGEQGVRRTLLAAARRMREDALLPLPKAVDAAALPGLLPEDMSAISPLWQSLGMGDEPAQRALLAAVRGALEAQLAEARAVKGRNHRLALSLGLIGGCAVFLFLL